MYKRRKVLWRYTSTCGQPFPTQFSELKRTELYRICIIHRAITMLKKSCFIFPINKLLQLQNDGDKRQATGVENYVHVLDFLTRRKI